MSNKKSTTKKALFSSIVSLLLCFTMLIGTTFAWFTDTVISAGNIIKSGTLDIEMQWADGTEAVPAEDSDDWKDASTGAIFNYDLWEPGYTEVRHIRIANVGSLALKYQLVIVANGEVSELAEVIDVYYVDPATPIAERTDLEEEEVQELGTLDKVLGDMNTTASGVLYAAENLPEDGGVSAHTVTIALKMQELAGNEYQDLSIGTNFSVQLVATQYTYEEDSFGDDYDANATYPDEIFVFGREDLQRALDEAEDGDTIVLGDDIVGDVTVTQKENVKLTIDGDNHTIAGSITVDGKSKRYETAGVTISNVKFAGATTAGAYINLGDGTNATRYTNNVTVSNCTFDYSGAGDRVAIKSYTGGDWNLTVDGCTAKEGMHSLVQVTNVEKGLTITNCEVYSKNGINLNNTPYFDMDNCTFSTRGYCVRFGVNGSTNNGNFTIANSSLTSRNDDGDAVIILRGTMTGATLNLHNTTLTVTTPTGVEIEGIATITRT